MGELLDALNSLENNVAAPEPMHLVDRAGQAFRSASQGIKEAIDAARAPGMPLDTLSCWTRQAPLQALSVAFLIGVIMTRRR